MAAAVYLWNDQQYIHDTRESCAAAATTTADGGLRVGKEAVSSSVYCLGCQSRVGALSSRLSKVERVRFYSV